MIHVTQNAAECYVARVNPALTLDEAREAITRHAPAIGKAVAFGCTTVLLERGIRLILDGERVVTVHDQHPAHSPVAPKILAREIRRRRRAREGAEL